MTSQRLIRVVIYPLATLACLCAGPVLGATAEFGTEPRARCWKGTTWFNFSEESSVEVTIDWGKWIVTSAPSSVGVAIIGDYIDVSCSRDICDNGGMTLDDYSYPFTEKDDDAADLVLRSISASASIEGHSVSRSASVTTLNGSKTMNHTYAVIEDNTLNCCVPGTTYVRNSATGWGVSARNFVLERNPLSNEDMSYDREQTIGFTFTHGSDWSGCCQETIPGCVPSDYAVVEGRLIVYSELALKVIRSIPFRGQDEYVQQGVYAIDAAEGSTLRLGFFADQDFDAEPINDGFEVEGSVVLAFTEDGDDLEEVVETMTHELILALDGDIDEDGSVCKSDRTLLVAARGAEIGTSAYVVRADLNLDGSIDQADFVVFNTLPCNADWDCRGTLTPADYFAFHSSFLGNDPAADVNGVGQLTSSDYSAFNVAFSAGC